MYRETTGEPSAPTNMGRYVKIAIIFGIALATFSVVGNQAVMIFMNIVEFDDTFTKPVWYAILSSLVLASISLIRVNGLTRSSIFWYVVYSGISLLNKPPTEPITNYLERFSDFKLTKIQFIIWQITKVLLFGAFFSNIMFGFATMEILNGYDLGFDQLPTLFTIPFVTIPTDSAFATENLIPIIPVLIILMSPLLAAIGLRIILFVGAHTIISVVTSYVYDTSEGRPRYLSYLSLLELLIGVGVLWTCFNMFFTSQIDYNTKYIIGGTLIIGIVFVAFSIIDRVRARVLTHILNRDVYVRFAIILLISLIMIGFVSVNNSIADAKKIEYLGPYTAQQIGVNNYLGELKTVDSTLHNITIQSISPNAIPSYIADNQDVLDVIRVWDWEAAFAKLKPEIGLIPYVDFEDNDILRFNDTLYWTASMKPILPPSVSLDNAWYNEHLVYTHVPNGFLTLEASSGQIVDSAEFFPQRTIYYGEGGLLDETWSAYPTTRGDTSAELGGVFYSGIGGIDVPPPLSYIFEPNFLLSFPTESVHIMRYKDINDRMSALYPYFLYNLFGKELDSIPVTDGENSYWLVPLIVGFDTRNIPWSVGNPYLRLVGYALIDTYDGDISLLKTGDDFFSEMFASQYEDKFIEIPTWLEEQIRYPTELFNWKTEMYNIYHVDNVETFIQANEFYEIPAGLDTYYIETKPPGFDNIEFLGLLSLELRGSQGRNLAGYMVVENDLSTLGDMHFYEIALNSTIKLIGPTAVREALDRDPDFAQLKTLLRNPRIGDNILYRVGEQDVYFIPVYTAGAGGVVAQLGTIAAVGASFTGEYYVGLGDTQEEAFRAYLQKLTGVTSIDASDPDGTQNTREDRISTLLTLFTDAGIDVLQPTTINIPVSFQEDSIIFYGSAELEVTSDIVLNFIDTFVEPRSTQIYMWEEDTRTNFGTLLLKNNILELHYISIDVGS